MLSAFNAASERSTLPHAVFCVSTAPTMISNVVSAGHHPVGLSSADNARYSDSMSPAAGLRRDCLPLPCADAMVNGTGAR